VPWDGQRKPRTEAPQIPPANRPLDCSDEEFERRLHAETDRSLRQDPERWVLKAAADTSDDTRPAHEGRIYSERMRERRERRRPGTW
jgi:hypothetical protein